MESSRRLRFTVLGLVAAIAACVSAPPVQEMSDARQAIAAAREAGAAERAPEPLADAQRLLETAEMLLEQRAYNPARINAVRAKNRAGAALEEAQEASAPGQ